MGGTYSGTSDKGPSEIGTTSLQGTKLLAPKYPFFIGSTLSDLTDYLYTSLLIIITCWFYW